MVDILERTKLYLTDRLNIRVSQDTPANRKSIEEFLVMYRSGGSGGRFLDLPRLTIDCFSTSGANAYTLAKAVSDCLIEFPDYDVLVSDVAIASIYRNEWVDGSPCYSINCSLIVNR